MNESTLRTRNSDSESLTGDDAWVGAHSETPRRLTAQFNNVSKGFGGLLAVRDLQLDIREGEFTCVVGPSGCGKSTLLNMLSGLDAPTSGVVLYEGKPVLSANHDGGYITQRDLLLPWRTVTGNIKFSLEVRGWGKQAIRKRVAEVLEIVGLTEAANAYPYQLSGGMRKRVSIGRVLAYEPSVLLMDEPFGSLDAQLRMQMHDELLRIWQAGQTKSVIFVTHDLAEAITLADRVVVMSGRPGTITLDLPIDIERPRHAVAVQSDPRYPGYFSALWEALGH
jgi:NitT/TauT family transport system ATP-binding protein